MARPGTVLWHIEISHFNEKARWALDYKGIPYRLRTPLPGLHRPVALALTRGKHDRLPIADLDGTRVGDSTEIIGALEERYPDPPLYPSDQLERARALELEDYFDEEVAPRVRRYVWHHTLDDADATVEAIATRAGPTRRRVLRFLVPAVRPLVKRDYDVGAATALEAAEGLRAGMDVIEAELDGRDYLVGDSFTVADLTAAALYTPVIAPPGRQFQPASTPSGVLELREELTARPGGAWIHEIYRRHRGTSAAVPAS